MALPPGPDHPPLYAAYQWVRRPLAYWSAQRERYGDAFTTRLPGMPPAVVFSRPESVRAIFADDGATLRAGEFNRSMAAILGTRSVLMLDGAEHRRQRKLLAPPFHGERMHAYGDTMIALTREAIARWPVGAPFRFLRAMQDVTLRSVLRTIFGVDGGTLAADAETERWVRALTAFTDMAAWSPLSLPFMQIDAGRRSPWGRFVRQRAEVLALLDAQIRRRRRDGVGARDDVLSLLLAARDEDGGALSDDELRDELLTLLVAGHETTASSLAWAVRWVLATPEVRARLEREVDGAVVDGALAAEKVARLEYLDAVVRETLRLHPVVPLVGRILAADARVAGWDLPRGTAVLCSMTLTQRRPDLHPRPDAFEPERFLGRRFAPYEIFPFGGGIRRCIGMAFAMQEMKMVLATVIRHTRLALAPGRAVRVARRSITLVPSAGLPVVMHARVGLG